MIAETPGPSWISALKQLRMRLHAAVRFARRVTAANRLATAALMLLLMFLAFALFADLIAPFPPDENHFATRTQPPSAAFWFGTDQLGRDIFSRVVHGTRGILATSVAAAVLGVAVGAVVGLISGYAGRWLDEAIMRVVDGLLSLPVLLLALLLLATLGPSRLSVVVAIAIVYIPLVARVVRSAVLAIKDLDFVRAARLRGEPTTYVLFGELLPNIWGPIIVEGSVRVSYAILLASSFGFLGLGVQEPDPDWGLMVSRARDFLPIAPWMAIFPVLAISLLVVSVNLFADALRARVGGLHAEDLRA